MGIFTRILVRAKNCVHALCKVFKPDIQRAHLVFRFEVLEVNPTTRGQIDFLATDRQ
jgi:hypothetical protein